jgi:hypothetical protein
MTLLDMHKIEVSFFFKFIYSIIYFCRRCVKVREKESTSSNLFLGILKVTYPELKNSMWMFMLDSLSKNDSARRKMSHPKVSPARLSYHRLDIHLLYVIFTSDVLDMGLAVISHDCLEVTCCHHSFQQRDGKEE